MGSRVGWLCQEENIDRAEPDEQYFREISLIAAQG
jgi:hypothetical protein